MIPGFTSFTDEKIEYASTITEAPLRIKSESNFLFLLNDHLTAECIVRTKCICGTSKRTSSATLTYLPTKDYTIGRLRYIPFGPDRFDSEIFYGSHDMSLIFGEGMLWVIY
jgi:hypothetical protein